MSSASIISSFKEDMEPVQCRCGLTTKIMMSTTTKSLGRRFYGSANHKKYFNLAYLVLRNGCYFIVVCNFVLIVNFGCNDKNMDNVIFSNGMIMKHVLADERSYLGCINKLIFLRVKCQHLNSD
jgi:hypothetical protein